MPTQILEDHSDTDWCADASPPVAVSAAASFRRRLPREHVWRKIAEDSPGAERASIIASYWLDSRREPRREETVTPADRWVIAVAMRTTRLKFSRGSQSLFDGVMTAGTLHVTGPGQRLEADLRAPSEFLHLFVSTDYLVRRTSAARGHAAPDLDLNDFILRDPAVEPLARSLIDAGEFYDELLADSVGQTIVTRLLRRRQPHQSAGAGRIAPLPRWRLKRVQDYMEQHADESLKLADLALAAGLSRMHFAAQFRAATGYSPCEYLRVRRIERAKQMLSNNDMPLVEVALSVGFQGQAHFSSVFRRVTGETPGQWRRASLDSSNDVGGRLR